MSSKKEIIKAAVAKVPMKDVGKDYSIMPETVKSSGGKHYPNIYISSDEAPFLEGVKVGDEETLVIKVKVMSSSERIHGKEVKCDYTLDIVKMGKPGK